MSKDVPRTERIKYVDPYNIGIQMKRKEPTKTLMMISNWKNPLVSMVHTNIFQLWEG